MDESTGTGVDAGIDHGVTLGRGVTAMGTRHACGGAVMPEPQLDQLDDCGSGEGEGKGRAIG